MNIINRDVLRTLAAAQHLGLELTVDQICDVLTDAYRIRQGTRWFRHHVRAVLTEAWTRELVSRRSNGWRITLRGMAALGAATVVIQRAEA